MATGQRVKQTSAFLVTESILRKIPGKSLLPQSKTSTEEISSQYNVHEIAMESQKQS